MAIIHSDARTLKQNQQCRYLQAEQDVRKHHRAQTCHILLLLATVLGVVGGGLYLFHLLQS